MDHSHHDPEELREIAHMLRSERPTLDPLALDDVKRRAIGGAQRSSRRRRLIRGSLVRSPAMVLSTVVLVAMGGGTALAVCGGSGGTEPPGEGENAGYTQYKNGCPSGYVEDKYDKECCVLEGKEGEKDGSYSGSYSYDKQSGSGSCCEGSSDKYSSTTDTWDQKSGSGSCCEGSSDKYSSTSDSWGEKSGDYKSGSCEGGTKEGSW